MEPDINTFTSVGTMRRLVPRLFSSFLLHTIQKKGESPDELSPMHTVFESLTILGTESLC